MTRDQFGCRRPACRGCDAAWKRRQEFLIEASVWIAERCPNVPTNEVATCAEGAAVALEGSGQPYSTSALLGMTFLSQEQMLRAAMPEVVRLQ